MESEVCVKYLELEPRAHELCDSVGDREIHPAASGGYMRVVFVGLIAWQVKVLAG